jgi:hypothetical protein
MAHPGTPVHPPFVFSSPDRPAKAAKRLKTALEPLLPAKKPLGWYKTVLSRCLGHESWEALRSSVSSPSSTCRLDHEVRSLDAIFERRRRQALVLSREAGIMFSTAEYVVNETEPSGNGSGVFRLLDTESLGEDEGLDDYDLAYRLPALPSGRGHELFTPAEERDDYTSPYGFVHMLGDTALDQGGERLVDTLRLDDLGLGRVRFVLGSGRAECSATVYRTLTGSALSDEPRPLRPTEMSGIVQKWHIEECAFPKRSDERMDVMGLAIAACMIREMIWAMMPPRPPVYGEFSPFLDINEGIETQFALGERVAGWHEYVLGTDAEWASEQDDEPSWSRSDDGTFRLASLCREIHDLEVIDE